MYVERVYPQDGGQFQMPQGFVHTKAKWLQERFVDTARLEPLKVIKVRKSCSLLWSKVSQITPTDYIRTSGRSFRSCPHVNGLLHLKSIHPVWKIFDNYTPGGVWIFKYTYHMCDFQIRFYLRGSKYFIRKPAK